MSEMSSQFSPAEHHDWLLREFAEEQLKNYPDLIEGDPDLELDVELSIYKLMDRFRKQSGRCILSGVKLSMQPNKFNSVAIRREPLSYVAAGIQTLLSAGFEFTDVTDHIQDVLTSQHHFGEVEMSDPCIQTSIHCEYDLEKHGLIVKRMTPHGFAVAQSLDSAAFWVGVNTYEGVPSVNINALENSLSNKVIFSTQFTTTSGTGSWSSTVGKSSSVITVGGNPLSNTATWHKFKSYYNQAMGSNKSDRDEFVKSSFINIPLADPKLFEKVRINILKLISDNCDFGPLFGDIESI